MRPRLATLFVLLVATAAVAATALGPGDPTAVLVDGFTAPCRTTVGPDGSLYVGDLGDHIIYKVTLDGTRTPFNDDIADPRGMSFDPFGNMLVGGRGDGTVWRVSPEGVASPFLTGITWPIRARVGPDGDIWVAAVDSVYHFDAMGREIERIDVISQDIGAYGLQFSPEGDLYITSWGKFGILEDGIVTLVPITEGVRNGGPHFDTSGNAYWIHESVEEGDTHRMVLADRNLTVTDAAFANFAVAPCSHVFGRDATGATTNRQYVSLRDGTIVEINAAGIPAPGVPETGLRLTDVVESEVVEELLLQSSAVTDDQLHFLDVIGNNEGAFDIGDFRAYLIATGTVE
ncbi:MAG: hypothetical protein KJO44_01465 [Gemmatimonadetes bacterium]|nr:hypothetical protein [Gemmatimonadota bacterium]NNK48415.1 hypothetical protein [Gemmatimonadota bacterium]